MRTAVLFATDLSPSSVAARTLLAGATWSQPTHVEVLHVTGPRDDGGIPDPALPAVSRALAAFTRPLARAFSGSAVSVATAVQVGDPAEVITRRAQALGASLIVVGSRGRGALVSALLGSVSSAVVERAHCSVLVARAGTVRSVLVADDGSLDGRAALEAVREGSLFPGLDLTVARVVDLAMPLEDSFLAERDAIARFEEQKDERIRQAGRALARRVRELRSRGRVAVGHVVEGDSARELVTLGRDVRADLIVLGAGRTHARSRAVAARQVLLGFRGSFLFARPSRPRAGTPRRADASAS